MTFVDQAFNVVSVNEFVAVPRKDLIKLEEARVDLIEYFTKDLSGIELTKMMCILEPITHQMWLVAHRKYKTV